MAVFGLVGLAVLLAAAGWAAAARLSDHPGGGSASPAFTQVTVTKTVRIKGRDGRVVTRVVRQTRTLRKTVLRDVTREQTQTQLVRLTAPGRVETVTKRVSRRVPVVRVRNRVVTVDGKPKTIAETVTNMQTQVQTVVQDHTQTQTQTQTQTVENTRTVTAPPETVTVTSTQTVTETHTVTDTQTVTQPAITVTVPGPG